MKKIILSSILGLMSAVAFAQTQPATQPHHTRAEWKQARQDCKAQVLANKPSDKKAGREAFRQCMESKGFKHHQRKLEGNPVKPVVQPTQQ